ncbi:hypothetical protein ebA5884 [Aromatoleum aromaticum EbN1]|uniref:Uncharacterized protein n=1 Tax=Aromatoleum aromaticum (strain DSM 19018 / LMG 30748 / EbN1) TaxID=76114 RepID=Q5NZP1_AROAE|nr:hypothetical protein ebA5884 [Aromatoleum aromaticum EbN1]
MPNILLLGFTVPDPVARKLFALDPSPAVQTHKFAWSLARTLQHGFGKLVLASACPIQNYPTARRVFFQGGRFDVGGTQGVFLGFVNLLVLKHLTRFAACLLTLPRLLRSQRVDWLFVHGIHTPFLLFGILARLTGRKLAVVLTDPPGVVLATDSRIARALKRLDVWLVSRALRHADAVIALAPELVRRLAIAKPALVFPGILDSSLVADGAVNRFCAESTGTFTIVYAGGLNRAYGVDRLLDAILGIDDVPVRLKLFGRGDQESRIRDLAASDSRIEYGGFVGNEVLQPELHAADLLINPRPTEEAFAAMSFPSKLIEYLATGRPILTTRIVSIPENYQPYFNFIDDESAFGIRRAVLDMIRMPADQRDLQGLYGQKFIYNEASEAAVGSKIVQFIQYVSSLR